MKHGEFIPEGGATASGRQALKRYCTPRGKKMVLFLSGCSYDLRQDPQSSVFEKRVLIDEQTGSRAGWRKGWIDDAKPGLLMLKCFRRADFDPLL